MSTKGTGGAPRRGGAFVWIGSYLRDERAAVSPILVLALVPIVGALGMGVEASNWWLTQRVLQNAADSAVIAAATNGGTTCSGTCTATSYTSRCSSTPGDYDCEAVAAANGEGVANGTANTSVFPQYLTSGCPASLSACYKVTITKSVPIHLLGIVGYTGTNGSQVVAAAAVGGVKLTTTPDCILALSTGSSVGVTTDGSPSVNLGGCSIQANSSENAGTGANGYAGKCNGHNLNADNFSSPGLDDGCANNSIVNSTPVTDHYLPLDNSTNVPADPCSGYPQEPKNNGTPLPSSNTPTGSVSWGSTQTFCGDVQLSGNLTINSNTTIFIYNGRLDLNGFTMASGSGDGVTIVFTGQNSFGTGGNATTPYHNLTGTGTLQIAAPTSGTWSGVAVYQTPYQTTSTGVQTPTTTPTTWPCTVSQCLVDSTITGVKEGSNSQSLDITAAGSSPNLWVQGGFYFPNANFTISGAIDNAQGLTSNGCFLLIAGVVNLNGQGSIFQNSQSQCATDGVTQELGSAYYHVLYQ